MSREEIIKKITQKRDFSQLPKKDVEIAFSHFENKDMGEGEKVKRTRELLHKAFGAFAGKKLLNPKRKESSEWFLRKHLSTRERLGYYEEIYSRILKNEKIIFDFGAGVNGFGYKYFGKKVRYVAIESVGQWVELMNKYFEIEGIDGLAIHESLFNLQKIKKIVENEKGKKTIFMFKVVDSLELLEKEYSKNLISEICPLVSKIVLSFPTESMVRRKKFNVDRSWLLEFLSENFRIIDEFEISAEKFVVFSKK